jgi:hypothetical protein
MKAKSNSRKNWIPAFAGMTVLIERLAAIRRLLSWNVKKVIPAKAGIQASSRRRPGTRNYR